MNVKGFDTYQRFHRALTRLEEGCAFRRNGEEQYGEKVGDMLRDSVIQRFEFTIELFWKTLRALLQLPPDAGSRTLLQEAYRNGWIDDEATWVALRNRTSHEYDELQAVELANKIDELYLSALQNARENLRQKMRKQDSGSGDSKLKE